MSPSISGISESDLQVSQSWPIGYGSARTRPHALEQAGLSSEDAGEVLGRAGI